MKKKHRKELESLRARLDLLSQRVADSASDLRKPVLTVRVDRSLYARVLNRTMSGSLERFVGEALEEWLKKAPLIASTGWGEVVHHEGDGCPSHST